MAVINKRYAVDFSACRKDLVAEGLDRMLSQHYDKCVLRQFVAVLLDQVQELHDALVDLQEKRTLYKAEAENLDVLGRIVGEPRAPFSYDESRWFFTDRPRQQPDRTSAWCRDAPFASFLPVGDEQYRMNILGRILKNHTLTASVPELDQLVFMLTGYAVSFEKTGPMEIALVVPSTLSATDLSILVTESSTARADESYAVPYPATLSISRVVTYNPGTFFCSDRDNEQRCDNAGCAVGASRYDI